MKHYLSIYKDFIKQYFKILMQSKVNFFIGVVCFIFSQISGILFLAIVFNQIPDLNGWSFYEILFIYGFGQLPRGIDHLFADQLWFFSKGTVVKGELDRYLLRPLNPLFQVFAEKLQLDAMGELLIGVIITCYSIRYINISISLTNILMFVVVIIAGAIIYTSIKLFFASLSFWIKQSYSILNIVYIFSDFAKYPISIYGKGIRVLISYLIPFGFTAFIPASYFLNKGNVITSVCGTCIVAFICVVISYSVWSIGIRNYESSGN